MKDPAFPSTPFEARFYPDEQDPRQVPSPQEAPLYTFDHDPTVDEMRAMAVRAMRDMVAVQWFPTQTVRYRKQGAVSNKQFEFLAERYYMGMPYTSAGMGLFQFLTYYDGKTGGLHFTDQDAFNMTIGNSCASSAGWGLLSVCSSVKGCLISNFLTVPNGFYPLGGVKYDPALADFKKYETRQIVLDNGEQRIMEGYAAAKPGDIMVFAEDTPAAGHTRMAIETPRVVRRADGTIDPEQSTLTTEEQAAKDFEDTSSGILMYRSGQVFKTYTFAEFLKKNYIAVTTAEFLGTKPYAKCVLTYEGKSGSLADLAAGTLRCNYPMAVLRFVADGVPVRHVLFDRKKVGSGLAREFPLAELPFDLAKALSLCASRPEVLSLQVVTSTGETFVPVTVQLH